MTFGVDRLQHNCIYYYFFLFVLTDDFYFRRQSMDVKMIFRCTQLAWQCQTQIRFPPMKKELSSRHKKRKKKYTYLNEHDVRKPLVIGAIYFTKKWRSETSAWFRIWHIKPRLEICTFKCVFWLNVSFFGVWLSGFPERGSPDLSNGTIFAPFTRQYIFCLHVYSLCSIMIFNASVIWNFVTHTFSATNPSCFLASSTEWSNRV